MTLCSKCGIEHDTQEECMINEKYIEHKIYRCLNQAQEESNPKPTSSDPPFGFDLPNKISWYAIVMFFIFVSCLGLSIANHYSHMSSNEKQLSEQETQIKELQEQVHKLQSVCVQLHSENEALKKDMNDLIVGVNKNNEWICNTLLDHKDRIYILESTSAQSLEKDSNVIADTKPTEEVPNDSKDHPIEKQNHVRINHEKKQIRIDELHPLFYNF